jgi:hypothetical protein
LAKKYLGQDKYPFREPGKFVSNARSNRSRRKGWVRAFSQLASGLAVVVLVMRDSHHLLTERQSVERVLY